MNLDPRLTPELLVLAGLRVQARKQGLIPPFVHPCVDQMDDAWLAEFAALCQTLPEGAQVLAVLLAQKP